MKKNFNICKKSIIIVIAVVVLIPQLAFANHKNSSSLQKKINKLDNDSVEEMAIPIMYGVNINQIFDSFGDPRSGGRSHEGIDIFAPRGTLIATPTEAVVTKIVDEDEGLGGLQVWTANPGEESFYYAHLNDIWHELEVGDELKIGDPIGFVGNTGNANLASPHLHLGIYDDDRNPINPYDRLTKTFDLEHIINALTEYIEYLIEESKK